MNLAHTTSVSESTRLPHVSVETVPESHLTLVSVPIPAEVEQFLSGITPDPAWGEEPEPAADYTDALPGKRRRTRSAADEAARERRHAVKAAVETHERKVTDEARAKRKHRKMLKRHGKARTTH